jgi:excinuclease UvrABC nuclease subunit
MMNTRGKVLMSLEAKDFTAALLQIRTGIRLLEEFFRKHGHEDAIPECQEIIALRKWAVEINEKRPQTLMERLRNELAEAVQNEDYERAAQLRDQLRMWEALNKHE